MTRPQYSPGAYRIRLQTSSKTHLLVEGPGDKKFFELSIDEAVERGKLADFPDHVVIDTAECLLADQGKLGNREKIESLCSSVDGKSYGSKLVGFVDREFRGFDWTHEPKDNINSHKVLGRLVWSRGHSIENYLFDLSMLRRPLRVVWNTDYFPQAFSRFKQVFESLLHLGCAVGLAAHELNRIRRVSRTIQWQMLDISSGQASIRVDHWRPALLKRNMTVEEVDEFVDRIQVMRRKLVGVDLSVVRWLSHGHIVHDVLICGYLKCVSEAHLADAGSHGTDEVRRILSAAPSEETRFRAMASSCIEQSLRSGVDYPIDVLNLLGCRLTDPKEST